MLHLLKYSFLHKVRDFSMVFWPLVFPLLLGTLFYAAFGRATTADFETVETAIVRAEDADTAFFDYLDELEDSSPELLHISEMTAEAADAALLEASVSGVFTVGSEPSLTVASNGLPESILESVLESYLTGKHTMLQVYETHPEHMADAAEKIKEYDEIVIQVSLGGNNANGNNQFFYTLIAMACLYGAFIGLGAAMTLQANVTPLAARKCAASTRKLGLVFSELLTAFGIHLCNMLILLGYLKLLGLCFNGLLSLMLLVIFFGTLLGVSLGVFVGSFGKVREGVKVAVILSVSMTGSFLAGLMSAPVKHLVDKAAPMVNLVNPAALISDAFYCINVFEDNARLTRDIGILAAETAVLVILSLLMVRRERYDSI